MVGCYLAPINSKTIKSVVAVITHYPSGAKLLVASDLNMYLDVPEGNGRNEAITAALAVEGLKDISAHFLTLQTNHWDQYGRVWSMVWFGQYL